MVESGFWNTICNSRTSFSSRCETVTLMSEPRNLIRPPVGASRPTMVLASVLFAAAGLADDAQGHARVAPLHLRRRLLSHSVSGRGRPG